MFRSKPSLGLVILFTMLSFSCHVFADRIQHLDAAQSASVVGNPVTQWSDLSGFDNHATPSSGGDVTFPGATTLGSGLDGLDFAPTKSTLALFSSTDSDAWLDQTAGNGFTVLIAYKVNSLVPDWNDLLGNSSSVNSGFLMRMSSGGNMRASLGGTTTIISGQSATAGDTVVFTFRYDPATSQMRLWDSLNQIETFGTVAPGDFSNGSPVRVGATTANVRFSDVLVGEIMVHDTALSNEAIGVLEEHLVSKWDTVGAPLIHLTSSDPESVQGDPVTAWEDQSGNAYDAVAGVGTVGFPGATKFSNGNDALDFGSVRNSLNIATAADSDAWLDQTSGNGFAVFVAFKTESINTSNWNDLIGNTSGVASGFGLRYNQTGTMQAYLGGNSINVGADPVVAGDEVVYSLHYDPAASEYRFWNSKTQTEAVVSLAPGDFSNGAPVSLGSTDSGGRYFNGLIGEVRVYDSALSADKVQEVRDQLIDRWAPSALPPPPPGPGFPNVTQTLGNTLGQFKADPIDDNVRVVVLDYVNGYLLMDTRGLEADGMGHAQQVWDISDPANPVEVHRIGAIRGMHKSTRFLPDYRVNHAGDDFYNVRDMLDIRKQNPPGLVLSDVGTRGAYLLPYQYLVDGSTGAIQITDTRIGTTPLSSSSAHGFQGQTIPIGNLLIVAGIRGQGSRAVATYDISDPSNPIFLDVIASNDPVWTETEPAYEAQIWKNFIVLPNVSGSDDCAFIDFSDPTDLQYVTKISDLSGRTRYAQMQDDHMFLGFGKYDMSPLLTGGDPVLVDTFIQDSEYLLPLGNLLVSAENSEQGTIEGQPTGQTKIIAHQAAPDTNPPTVAYHSPAAGATGQAVTTRVGLLIHEVLDYATINETTFRVFPDAGGADVPGTFTAMDKDVVTFTPDAPLAESTTYRVQLEADGIKDVSGNGMAAFSFTFTTSGPGGPDPVMITEVNNSTYPAPVNGSTTLTATAQGGGGTLEYNWTFGDGTASTGWSTSTGSIAHTYTAPGHYTVIVQVRDSSNPTNINTSTIVVTVSDAAPSLVASKGTQILLDGASRLVWTVNPDNNTVTSINADTMAKTHEVPVGADPRSIAQAANGDLWVACLDDDQIDILSSTNGALLNTINLPVGSRPHDVVFNSGGGYAYVTLKGSGKVVRIDPVTRQIDATLDAGATPTALAVSASGEKLLVNRFISPDSSGEVRSFDNAGNGSFGLEQMVALQEDTTSSDTGESARGLPNYLADVAIDHANGYAYVTAKQDNIARGEFRDGLSLTHDSTVRAILSKIDLATNAEVFSERVDIDDASQPSALLFTPLGDYLFVAIQGNNEVQIMDTFNGGFVATLSTGLAPQGLAFDPVTNQLFVKNLNDRSVTVHDLTSGLQKGQFNNAAVATVSTVANEVFAADVLLGKQVFYNAADERMAFEGYLSCAACHQDGDHDGRTWDFTDRGEGLRNTTNLRGRAGMAHGNVHWSANFDEIQDFELDIVNGFGGDGFTAEGPNPSLGAPNAGRSVELDALAAYVASLGNDSVEKSPHRDLDGTLSDAAAIGKQLFEGTIVPASGTALSCVTCHNPSSGYTDSVVGDGTAALHDVGTLKASSGERLGGGASSLVGIDTPTLMGLHASAPYLHDGSAATLSAVFDQFDSSANLGEDGSAHDLSATGYNLTAGEKDDLIAFLLQIDGGADVTPPAVPSGLLSNAGDASVSLDWGDNTESDFASYNVYRSQSSGTYGAALATGLTSSDYIDFTALNGVTYYYAVTAVDSLGNESEIVNETSATPTSPNPAIRVTEYYLTTGDFSGTTVTVTLDQALADDYFILVRGSRTGDGTSNPNNDYARVVSVPGGKGDLADSGSSTSIGLQRTVADHDWEGVVTVVECQNPQSPAGFALVDAVETSMTGTSGTDSGAAWSDINQVVLFGGYRGGGVEMSGTPTNRKQGTGCYTRLYPSGSNTLNWTRDAGGETMFDATMTTFVVEWGSEWNIQRVNVAGNNGGGGADVAGEYTTAAISPVARANTWVWGTGTRVDSGIGDCAEACLVTLGDGVLENATESTVAVGSEYTDAYDFDVYTLTHVDLNVDHRFKADGDSAVLDLPVTVDMTSSGARFGWIYNGCSGTGSHFPRPRMWARYTDDSTVTVSRGYDGQNFPAWVQGIDLSGLNQ